MVYTIPAGVTILKEGEVNLELFKLISGNCEVYTDYGTERESILGILSKGAFFGEIGFFSGKASIYTVVAYSEVEIEKIPIAEFKNYFIAHSDDLLALMKNMSESMYNLRFNMELMAREAQVPEKASSAGNDAYLREQLKKYNLLGMKSISFYTAEV